MTAPIIGPPRAPKADTAAQDKATKTAAEMKQAAAAFEAILVRQMLASAQVAGKGSYADMGVEALSTAVQQGGGLGLGHAIERAIGAAHPGPKDAKTPSASKK